MKSLKFLVCLAFVVVCTQIGAVSFYLQIDQVNPNSVSGRLSISNLSDEDIVLDFPTGGTFDLMVDGNLTNTFYPDPPTSITIPQHSTITRNVSYYGTTVFGSGSHVAQARYVLPGNPAAGQSRTFYVGTPLTGVENLDYQLEVLDVGSYGLSATLHMHNPNEQYWMMNFSNGAIARLYVDGHPGAVLYPPIVIPLYIDAGETYNENISYGGDQLFSPGWHTAQARLFLADNPPVGAPFNFFVGTEASDEEIALPSQALQINLYPNPCTTELKISSMDAKPLNISIYNSKGRKVMETSGNGDLHWNGRDPSGKACPSGIYIVKARQGAKSAVQRFVKLR